MSPVDERDHERPKTQAKRETVDYRKWNRIAEDQGAVNECVFAGGESCIQYPINKLRGTDISNGSKMVNLDSTSLYYMCCDLYYDGDRSRGAYPRDLMKMLKNNGMMEVSPNSGELHKIKDYWRNRSVEDIERSLLDIGPCTVMFEWFSGYDTCKRFLEPRKGYSRGYHQTAIEGLDYIDDKLSWIIRNSYGTRFADMGYYYIQYEHMEDILLESWSFIYDFSLEQMADMINRDFMEN